MPETIIEMIGIEQLAPNPHQPRKRFDKEKLNGLAATILQHGILQPIVVKKRALRDYVIIAGERRWRAAQIAELSEIRCIIQNVDDETLAAAALIENLQREPLNPIEEAMAFEQMQIEFNCSQEELAKKLGVSREKIAHSLHLLKCIPKLKQYIIEEKLTSGHGKALASLHETHQLELAMECIKHNWSVRQLESASRALKKKTSSKTSKKRDPNIDNLTSCLTDHFATEVQVVPDNDPAGSGWLKFRYFNNDTLSGILNKMGIK